VRIADSQQRAAYLSEVVAVALLLVAGAPARAPAAERALVQDGGVRVQALDGQTRDFDLRRDVEWGQPLEPRVRPLVVLRDGGLLPASLSIGQPWTVESLALGGLTVKQEEVAGVIGAAPVGRSLDTLLDWTLRQRRIDEVLLGNGDRLAGRVAALDAAQCRMAEGPQVARDTIAAIGFAAPAAAPGREAVWWVGLADGTRLAVDNVAIDRTSAKLHWRDRKLETPASEVVWLVPPNPSRVFLSDLVAADFRHVPYLSLAWPYQRDRSTAGSLLRAGGRLYAKGLGMHAASRLTYQLTERFTTFSAELAIDDETRGLGSARFRVFVDGVEKFTSQTIRGGDKPVPMTVAIDGAKRLDLVVDFADRGDQGDHADWLNARLMR